MNDYGVRGGRVPFVTHHVQARVESEHVAVVATGRDLPTTCGHPHK